MVRIKTLLNLLGSTVAVLALAPVLPYLEGFIIGFAVAGVVVGLWCDRTEKFLLNGPLATLVAVAGIIFYGIQVTLADVATPVIQALIVLLIIRLLTRKEARDYLQIFVLGLFILAGSSLVSLDLGLGFGFLTYLVLMVFSVTLGLVLLTVYVTDKRLALPRQDLYKLVKVSLIMPVVSLVLMVVFFFVLPRTRHPLWNFLNPGGTANVGLAETVQPGAYSRISAQNRLAFRAEVEQLAPEDLYWRALVMNQSKGRTWVRVEPPRENSRIVGTSRTVKLMVYPEARSDHYLITLDRPGMVSGMRYRQSEDHIFTARSDLDHPYRLEQFSHLDADLQVQGSFDRRFYLIPPDLVSDRMQDLATSLREGSDNLSGRIAALAEFFRNQELTYAQDDLPGGADPIDDFLFDSKRGYCEFFATAYINLARLAGVPARLVGGYFGGQYNPIGGYYLVGEETAHVWVEVLTDENRWVRVDPSQWAINAATAFETRQASTLSALQQFIDSLNYRWVQTVLLFDFTRQLDLFRETRDSFRTLKAPEIKPQPVLVAVSLVAGLVVIVFLLRRPRLSPEARLLVEFRNRVRKRYGAGVISAASGLSEVSERLGDENCRAFARIYQAAVFHDRPLTDAERGALRELLKKI